MSVIIEDMTIPECCMKCPMVAGYGCGYMRIAMATKDMESGRHEDCPLGEVSKPNADEDTISRRAAIDAAINAADDWEGGRKG